MATDSSSTATFSYTAPGLPAGLTITSAGLITGTPITAGAYPVALTATDSAGATGSASFTWTVTNTITVTNPGPQSGASGSPITDLQVIATDSSSTATLAYAATGLPGGLSIGSSTGLIAGTPTTSGTFPVTVTVSDGAGSTTPVSFTWTLTNPIVVTVPGPVSDVSGQAIAPWALTVADSSSEPTLSYSDGATLPPGVSIDATTGTISGTPTAAGTYPVVLTVTDAAGSRRRSTSPGPSPTPSRCPPRPPSPARRARPSPT